MLQVIRNNAYLILSVKLTDRNLFPMSQIEFNNCPKCGTGKMKPTGGAAVSNNPQTGKETGFTENTSATIAAILKEAMRKYLGSIKSYSSSDHTLYFLIL